MSKFNWFRLQALGVFSATTLLIASASTNATAGIIATYTDRGLFESDVTGLITETFDSFATDTTFHETSLDVGDFSLLSSGNNMDPVRRNKIDVPALEFGLFDLNGSAVANISVDPGKFVLVTFEDAIMAFGADFAHFNDGMLRSQIIVNGEVLDPPLATATEKRFFGFTSDTPFTVVKFRGVVGTGGDGFGIDNISHSEECGVVPNLPVPEPTSLLSFAALMVVAGGVRRRR